MTTLQPKPAQSQSQISKLSTSLSNHRLSLGARILHSLLVTWSGTKGYAWWSVQRMAGQLGRCERSVQYYLAQLERAGLLLRVACPNHSSYYIPYPADVEFPIQQLYDGNLAPRRRGYDPHSWESPPVQDDLDIPAEPAPREAVQNLAPIKENKELSGGVACDEPPQSSSDSLKTKEEDQDKSATSQENIFAGECESMAKGWELVFNPYDPSPMLRIISYCTGDPIHLLEQEWKTIRSERQRSRLVEIASNFCRRIAFRLLGVPADYPKRE